MQHFHKDRLKKGCFILGLIGTMLTSLPAEATPPYPYYDSEARGYRYLDSQERPITDSAFYHASPFIHDRAVVYTAAPASIGVIDLEGRYIIGPFENENRDVHVTSEAEEAIQAFRVLTKQDVSNPRFWQWRLNTNVFGNNFLGLEGDRQELWTLLMYDRQGNLFYQGPNHGVVVLSGNRLFLKIADNKFNMYAQDSDGRVTFVKMLPEVVAIIGDKHYLRSTGRSNEGVLCETDSTHCGSTRYSINLSSSTIQCGAKAISREPGWIRRGYLLLCDKEGHYFLVPKPGGGLVAIDMDTAAPTFPQALLTHAQTQAQALLKTEGYVLEGQYFPSRALTLTGEAEGRLIERDGKVFAIPSGKVVQVIDGVVIMEVRIDREVWQGVYDLAAGIWKIPLMKGNLKYVKHERFIHISPEYFSQLLDGNGQPLSDRYGSIETTADPGLLSALRLLSEPFIGADGGYIRTEDGRALRWKTNR